MARCRLTRTRQRLRSRQGRGESRVRRFKLVESSCDCAIPCPGLHTGGSLNFFEVSRSGLRQIVDRRIDARVALDLIAEIDQRCAEISEIKLRGRGRSGDLIEALPDRCEGR